MKAPTRLLFSVCAAALLASCTASGVTSAKVDAAVVALTTAERLALVYTSLPRCPAPAPCSDPALVSRIKSYDNTAYAAVKAAERNEALLDAALSSIASLQSAIPPVTAN